MTQYAFTVDQNLFQSFLDGSRQVKKLQNNFTLEHFGLGQFETIKTKLGRIITPSAHLIVEILKMVKHLSPRLEFNGTHLKISAGSTRYEIFGMLEPTIPGLLGAEAIHLEIDQQVWKYLNPARATEDNRRVFQHLQINPQGQMLATDGLRLHSVNTEIKLGRTLIIPKEVVLHMSKVKSTRLTLDGEVWRVGELEFQTVEGEFPDWKRLIPDRCDADLDHLEAFKTILTGISKATKGNKKAILLGLGFEPGRIKITQKNDLMDVSEQLEQTRQHSEMNIRFRAHQLLAAMNMQCESIQIAHRRPAMIRGTVAGLAVLALVNPLNE